MAKKVVITTGNLEKFLDHENKCVLITKDLILTPGARDKAANLKYKIVYENLVHGNRDNIEKSNEKKIVNEEVEKVDGSLDFEVKQLLRREYNIVNEFEVQMTARKVMDIIKNNEKL